MTTLSHSVANKVWDIEDLKELGKKHEGNQLISICISRSSLQSLPIQLHDILSLFHFIFPFFFRVFAFPSQACPYFTAKNRQIHVDLVICPYNYILDPAIREAMDIDVKGDIIIFDEAQ